MNDDELMDQMLREAMRDDVPQLSAGFDDRVMAVVRPRRLSMAGRAVLGAYTLVAASATMWLMRDLPAGMIGAATLAGVSGAVAVSAYLRRMVSEN